MQCEDLYSLLEVQGCFLYAWLALNPSESSYRSQPAQMKNENGTFGYGCYSLYLRLGTASMDGMECIGTCVGKHAQVNDAGQVKMQNALFLAEKW